MIKTAIPVLGSMQWWGGVTYLSNLLYAVSQLEDPLIEPVVFAGMKTDKRILAMCEPYSQIIRTPVFDVGSAAWFFERAASRLSGEEVLLARLLKRNDVSVISHLSYGVRGTSDYRTIAWIADFQHLHLPGMFSPEEFDARNRSYACMAAKCDLVILSSRDAMEDFCSFAPEYSRKARVLHFVAQPEPAIYEVDRRAFEEKLGIERKYFFLPNQFWKHKNHKVVFDAVKIVKDRHRDILLLCSGVMSDSRNRDHVRSLTDYITFNGLERNIRLLGMVDKQLLFCLMRNCISIINPSLFEGWSTTVEEAKSTGKRMILSDIAVHREQAPPGGVYFDPHNAEELADILIREWDRSEGGPDFELERAARASLGERTRLFGEAYQRIIMEVCG